MNFDCFWVFFSGFFGPGPGTPIPGTGNGALSGTVGPGIGHPDPGFGAPPRDGALLINVLSGQLSMWRSSRAPTQVLGNSPKIGIFGSGICHFCLFSGFPLFGAKSRFFGARISGKKPRFSGFGMSFFGISGNSEIPVFGLFGQKVGFFSIVFA